jgi:heavy metal sensor kinase
LITLTLRKRILAWFVGLTGLLLIGFSVALYLQTRQALYAKADASLGGAARALAMRVEAEWGRFAIEPLDVGGAGPQDGDAYLGGAVYTFPEGKPVGFVGPGVSEALFKAAVEPWFKGDTPGKVTARSRAQTVEGPKGRPVRIFTGLFQVENESWGGWSPGAPEGKGQPRFLTILVASAADFKEVQETLTELVAGLLTAGSIALLLAVLAGMFLARRITRPLAAIAKTAESIQLSDLTREVPRTGTGDEIDRLAEVLNQAFHRLREAFERQTRFTADASHELRNPVAVIKSHAEIALSKPREPEAYREALQEIQSASDRLRGLLEGLLFLARADNRQLQAAFEATDLAELAREGVESFEAKARERSVSLAVEAPSPLSLSGDRVLLSMLMRNLLSNAVRHCREGGKVTVGVNREGEKAVLKVEDEGEGISAEVLPKIFERFFRVDEARTREAGGTGLGLAIVKTVAQVHGGEVSATSTPGEGTTVRVHFPAGGQV